MLSYDIEGWIWKNWKALRIPVRFVLDKYQWHYNKIKIKIGNIHFIQHSIIYSYISDNDDGDRYKTVILGPSKPYDIDKAYKDGAGIPHNDTNTINSTNLMITQIYGDK